MSLSKHRLRATRLRSHALSATALVGLFALGLLTVVGGAAAAATSVSLGTADSFAVLAGTGVSNVPTSTITGDVGVSPTAGTSITGLTCEEVVGTIYAVDDTNPLTCDVNDADLLTTAKADLVAAYGDAAGQTPDDTYLEADNQLGGKTPVPGVYRFGSASTANLIGDLTLDGDADSVWVFQATSDLVIGASSRVILAGEAQACNVFWQVGSSATLNTSAQFVGNVLALTSIFARSAATIEGRLLAQNGAVTLDNNTITRSSCAAVTTTSAAATTTAATTAVTTTAATTTAATPTTTAAATTAAVAPTPTPSTTATPTPTAEAVAAEAARVAAARRVAAAKVLAAAKKAKAVRTGHALPPVRRVGLTG